MTRGEFLRCLPTVESTEHQLMGPRVRVSSLGDLLETSK